MSDKSNAIARGLFRIASYDLPVRLPLVRYPGGYARVSTARFAQHVIMGGNPDVRELNEIEPSTQFALEKLEGAMADLLKSIKNGDGPK